MKIIITNQRRSASKRLTQIDADKTQIRS